MSINTDTKTLKKVETLNLDECLQSAKDRGKALYYSNKTMRDIATVMENPEFKQFFSKYFKTSDDAQNIIQLMKIYENIKLDDPYEKICVLFEALNNSNIRHTLTNNFIHWRDTGNKQYELTSDYSVCQSPKKSIKKKSRRYKSIRN